MMAVIRAGHFRSGILPIILQLWLGTCDEGGSKGRGMLVRKIHETGYFCVVILFDSMVVLCLYKEMAAAAESSLRWFSQPTVTILVWDQDCVCDCWVLCY